MAARLVSSGHRIQFLFGGVVVVDHKEKRKKIIIIISHCLGRGKNKNKKTRTKKGWGILIYDESVEYLSMGKTESHWAPRYLEISCPVNVLQFLITLWNKDKQQTVGGSTFGDVFYGGNLENNLKDIKW